MKQAKIYNTNFVRTGYGKDDITEERFLEAEITYNEQDKITREVHYNAQGEMESIVENEYDAQGRTLSSAQYDGSEELCQKNTFYYGEDGSLEVKGSFFGEGSPEYITKCVYEDGRLVREDSYDGDEFAYTEKRYEYDASGLASKIEEFDEDGQLMYNTIQKYDANGLLIGRMHEMLMENDSRTFVFEYDSNKRKIKELLYNYNQKLIAKAYYAYDEAGNMVEQEEENLDMYRRTTFTYEGSRCIKVEQYDKERKLSWTEYEYDDHGEAITIRNYISDEVDPENYRVASVISYEITY